MKTSSAIYGVQLNDIKRDGSSASEIFHALKRAELDQLRIPDLAGPCDKAILVFDCAQGGSIYAGVLLPSDFSLNEAALKLIRRSVDAWWSESEEARLVRKTLELPIGRSPTFNIARDESPAMSF